MAKQELQANQEWIEQKVKRIELLHQHSEERLVQAQKWLNWLFGMLGRSTNTWMFFVVWTVVIGTWGWIGGINTPMGIFCPTRSSLCYSARFWGEKTALSDVKNPQCTQTRKGLMCLVKPASKKSAPSANEMKRQK